MATTTMSNGVAALARQIAQDQIAQDIKNNAKFATKDELLSLEQQIIAVCNDIVSGTQTTQVNTLSEEK